MSKRKRHHKGYLAGFLLGVIALILLSSPKLESFLAPGPMNTGHGDFECKVCHREERGNFRQQLQANTQFLFGNRHEYVSVGYRSVTNTDCLSCHERPNDRHPVYRFFEPKYSEARKAIGAHQCNSCHQEHSGKHVTIKAEFCQHCHDELKLKKDPVNISHHDLIKQKRWSSCIGCHDYHGNHRMKAATKLEEKINEKIMTHYFEQGENPYAGKIIHKAKTPEEWHEN